MKNYIQNLFGEKYPKIEVSPSPLRNAENLEAQSKK